MTEDAFNAVQSEAIGETIIPAINKLQDIFNQVSHRFPLCPARHGAAETAVVAPELNIQSPGSSSLTVAKGSARPAVL